MDTAYTIGAYTGFAPLDLRTLMEHDHYPMAELRALSGHPDYVGFSDRGASLTDRDVCVAKDVRLKTRILLESTMSEDENDHTMWLIPFVFYRGLPTFSITTKVAPAEVLDRCTASSDVPALGMKTSSRQYSGNMYGGAIDITAEAIQRSTDAELAEHFRIKEKQLSASMQMTQKHLIYGQMMGAPTTRLAAMCNGNNVRGSKAETFVQYWQNEKDDFIMYNLRRTSTSATFLDLDNSLRDGSKTTSCTAPDVLLLHPVLYDKLEPNFTTVSDGSSRQVYYQCSNSNKKELDESDFLTLKGAEYYVPCPKHRLTVNGSARYVMRLPELTLNDGNRRNVSELEATFKSYCILGYNPLCRGRLREMSFNRITRVPWNEIKVTDLDMMTDGTVRMLDVMKNSGYLEADTYKTSRYQRMFNETPALSRIMRQMHQTEYDRDCLQPMNLTKRSCLLRPSRKVFYVPQKRAFAAAIAYGHSELPESPIDEGDVVAGMTMMANCLLDEESFEKRYTCAFRYLRTCLGLKWTGTQCKDLKELDKNNNDEAAGRILLDDVHLNDGATHYVEHRHLSRIKDILLQKLNQDDLNDNDKKFTREALAAVQSVLTLVEELLEKYTSLTASDANHTHSWLFTNAAKVSFRRSRPGQSHGDTMREVFLDRVVLRTLSPKIYAVTDDERWKPHVHDTVVTFCQALHDHTNVACRVVGNDEDVSMFLSTAEPSVDCRNDVQHVTDHFPYYSNKCPRAREEYFVNRNYSHRVNRVASLPLSYGVRMFTILFQSMLQNPLTTRLLAEANVYLNTAFLIWRNVKQLTCSGIMARSGENNRFLFLGNGKVDTIETNASSYKTSTRIELTYVDVQPMENTRVQHYLGGLGYCGGMGSKVINQSVRDQRQGKGDFFAVPIPAAFNPESTDIMMVNGRASVADGNENQSLDQLDEVTDKFTANPYATVGASEAQLMLGLTSPLWRDDFSSFEQAGAHSLYLRSRNPPEQYKAHIDSFFKPIDNQSLMAESNVAMQGRQFHENSQFESCAFKTINKGFYGENENSTSSFRNLLDLTTSRKDEGMLLVDPVTCMPTLHRTDDRYIKTGLKKQFPP